MSKFKWVDTGEPDVYFSQEDDPVLAGRVRKKESGFTWDISRLLQDIPYSGTSTQQEMLELEQIMRDLISEGKYGYKYIENLLLSLNYSLNKIRRTFRKLTGVDPDVYLDAQPYLDTPPSIPQINYGWGKSKDRSYDYYFVMPWNNKYCVFGQKGDTDRFIVSEHYDLEEALKALEKKVELVMRYDRVLTKNDLVKKDRVFVPEELPLGVKVAAEAPQKDVVTETLQEEDFFDEKTPAEFFEEVTEEDTSSIVDAVRSIFDYVESLNIPGYVVTIKDLMYRSRTGEVLEAQPSVEGVEVTRTTFEVPSYFVVVLLFKRGDISKKGMTVFLFDKNKNVLETRGTFKGEDGKLYGLNQEGLDQYFNI